MDNTFWAGLLGAGLGSAAGAYAKRVALKRAAPVAVLTAVAVFLLVSAILALLT